MKKTRKEKRTYKKRIEEDKKTRFPPGGGATVMT
jgi:hypothetical protein